MRTPHVQFDGGNKLKFLQELDNMVPNDVVGNVGRSVDVSLKPLLLMYRELNLSNLFEYSIDFGYI